MVRYVTINTKTDRVQPQLSTENRQRTRLRCFHCDENAIYSIASAIMAVAYTIREMPHLHIGNMAMVSTTILLLNKQHHATTGALSLCRPPLQPPNYSQRAQTLQCRYNTPLPHGIGTAMTSSHYKQMQAGAEATAAATRKSNKEAAAQTVCFCRRQEQLDRATACANATWPRRSCCRA